MSVEQAKTIRVSVNDSLIDVPAGASITDLVQQLGLQLSGLAVELNLEIIPKTEYSNCTLKPQDRLEIVSLVGGG